MNNLKNSTINAITFFDDVVNLKKNTKSDPTYKVRVNLLRNDIQNKFNEYDTLFVKNNLVTINPFGYTNQDKVDLLKLYSYQSKIIQKLKNSITTTEHNRIINTCQNCTISEVNSFDHIIPKNEFPEFSVNPKNLFPSCTICNGYKSEVWRHNGTNLFLNLYLDKLPLQQYLFVLLDIKNNNIDVKFIIDNRNKIEQNLFDLLYNHYLKLRLTQRFEKSSHDIIIELKNSILEFKNHINKTKIQEATKGKIIRDKEIFGQNYWKAILTEELINNDDFIDPLLI